MICVMFMVPHVLFRLQECPTPIDKVVVLEEMIFPQCEKLGQTIIFVRTREIARTLHAAVRAPFRLWLSLLHCIARSRVLHDRDLTGES